MTHEKVKTNIVGSNTENFQNLSFSGIYRLRDDVLRNFAEYYFIGKKNKNQACRQSHNVPVIFVYKT